MTMLARILLFSASLAAPAAAELTVDQTADTLTVRNGEALVFTYRTDQQVPCLYPLHGPAGTNLTRHFPFKKDVAGEQHDHPHHLSFWTAHGMVNGVDFWHGKEAKIVHEGFIMEADAFPAPADAPDLESLTFTVRLKWTKDEQPILKERRTYSLTVLPGTYLVTQSSTFSTAGQDVVFGDTKEGFLGFRLAPTLRLKGEVAKGHIANAEGLKDKQVWGKRSEWVAYHGPDSEGNPTVVALMDHPDNLRHPTWWHARDYGLLAANPFGIHDFEGRKKQPELGNHVLKQGETMTQRYHLLLHYGDLQSAKVEDHFDTFAR